MSEHTFRYRVLIVDDEASLGAIGKASLKSKGCQVRCAKDGLEGLAAQEGIARDGNFGSANAQHEWPRVPVCGQAEIPCSAVHRDLG